MSEKLRHRIQRAKRINALMTGVFTGIGGFFLGLIIVLAGYIIIHGLMSYYPGLLSFTSKGNRQSAFQHRLSGILGASDQRSFGSACRHIHGGICGRHEAYKIHPCLH